jgi:hypothetical protein
MESKPTSFEDWLSRVEEREAEDTEKKETEERERQEARDARAGLASEAFDKWVHMKSHRERALRVSVAPWLPFGGSHHTVSVRRSSSGSLLASAWGTSRD